MTLRELRTRAASADTRELIAIAYHYFWRLMEVAEVVRHPRPGGGSAPPSIYPI